MDDITKIGSYGLGFSSVYHLTDVPSFVSGEKWTILDPNQKFLNSNFPGGQINFVEDNLIEKYPNQFEPYCLFGYDLKSRCNGTLFRFPLRTEENFKDTDLPKVSWNSEQIRNFFTEYFKEARYSLLFLKYVERIEFYIRNENGLTEIFNISMKIDELNSLEKSIIPNYISKIASSYYDTNEEEFAKTTIFHFDCTTNHFINSEKVRIKWLMCNQLDSSNLTFAKNTYVNANSKFIPWTGICIPLEIESANEDIERIRSDVLGRTFCFLPLPIPNYMPINLNGYFAVSASRREIWSGEGLQGDSRIKAEWNKLCLTKSIPLNYVKLIEHLKDNLANYNLNIATYYSHFSNNLQNDFNAIVTEFYKLLVSRNTLCFRSVNHPRLIQSNNWITYQDAFFLDLIDFNSVNIIDDNTPGLHQQYAELTEFIIELFAEKKRIVLECPSYILDEFSKVDGVIIQKITPQLLRTWIREENINFSSYSHSQVYSLIDYLTSDRKIDDFEGLKIIPLKNNTFTCFRKLDDKNINEQVILFSLSPSSEEFLKNLIVTQMEDRVILLPQEIVNLFLDRNFNVMNLTFSLFLKYLLPIFFKDVVIGKKNKRRIIEWKESIITEEYLTYLWKWLTPQILDDLKIIQPIILASNRKLYPYSEVSQLVSFNNFEERKEFEDAIMILEDYGVVFIDLTTILNNVAIPFKFRGILNTLLSTRSGDDTLVKYFKGLPPPKRKIISEFFKSLLKREGINYHGDLKPDERKVLASISTDLVLLNTNNFHLRENLTDRIAKIIRDYGSNINMLKEMLQNADDSSATIMK